MGKRGKQTWANQGTGGSLGRGVRKSSASVSVCLCFHLHPTVLGSSLVSVCRPYLTFCLCLWSDRTS